MQRGAAHPPRCPEFYASQTRFQNHRGDKRIQRKQRKMAPLRPHGQAMPEYARSNQQQHRTDRQTSYRLIAAMSIRMLVVWRSAGKPEAGIHHSSRQNVAARALQTVRNHGSRTGAQADPDLRHSQNNPDDHTRERNATAGHFLCFRSTRFHPEPIQFGRHTLRAYRASKSLLLARPSPHGAALRDENLASIDSAGRRFAPAPRLANTERACSLKFECTIAQPDLCASESAANEQGMEMEKLAQNIQEAFLNNARKEKSFLTIYLMSGVKLSGRIKSFDKYSVILETNNQEQLIFKHAISTVVVSKPFHSQVGQHAPAAGANAGAHPSPGAPVTESREQ